MTPVIRNATVEDVPPLVELYRQSYEENEKMGFSSSVVDCDHETVMRWVHNRTVLVAILSGEIVGVVQVISRSDWDSGGAIPEIGRRLLESAEEYATSGVKRPFGSALSPIIRFLRTGIADPVMIESRSSS